MDDGPRPGTDPELPADLEEAAAWLAGHELTGIAPTPLLAARLAVRRRARLAASVLLAVFICAVALVYVSRLPTGDAPGGLLAPAATAVGLVLGQVLLDRWVRQVDRRAGAALPRRAAHPVRLGWRTVLGAPRAAFALTTFAGALVLGIVALTAPDPAARDAGVVLLTGLGGAAVAAAVQLRHVLTHPVVADDEASLTVDLLMRVEDARAAAVPTVVWSLPVVSVFSTGLGWWNAAWLGFIVLGVVALVLLDARTARSAAVARDALGAR